MQSNPSERPTVWITGSTGLIGSRLCRVLGREHRVVGFDRDPPREDAPERWIECDLTRDASVADALRSAVDAFGPRVASVVHLAAYYDFAGEPSPLYDELTVAGTRRLLRGLRSCEVEQFVFSSSLLAMAPVEEGGRLDESSPTTAEWDYPRSKLQAEQVLREERGSIATVVLRIAGVYDEDGHSPPLTQQMKRIYERTLESHLFPGDPDHGQSFVHLDDLVELIRLVIERRHALPPQELFVVGESELVSYGETQEILGRVLHDKAWSTLRIPAPLAKAGAWIKDKLPGAEPFIKPWMIDLADAHRPVEIEHALRTLGWRPRHSLRRTLPEMARRLRADPRRWYEENGIEPPPDLPRAGTP